MLRILRNKIRGMIARELHSGELRILLARVLRSVGKDILTDLLTNDQDIARLAGEYERRITAVVDPNHCILGYEAHDFGTENGIVHCARCGYVPAKVGEETVKDS